MQQLAPCPSQPPRPIPYGLVSLWDMMNFNLYDFVWATKLIRQEWAVAAHRLAAGETVVSASDMERFKANLENGIAPALNALFIAEDRLGTLHTGVRLGTTYAALEHELKALDSDAESAIKYERFYHYPRDRGLMVLRVPGDWAATLKAFPSSKEDIEAAVDCYALGHDRASIHHSMMVLEDGLISLAVKFKVKFNPDRTTWAPLIDNIRKAIANELDKLANQPKGSKHVKMTKKRKEFLEACQEAALDLRHFKNVWRDHIAHNRGDYDENDAKKALDHVRSFMEVASFKLKLMERR